MIRRSRENSESPVFDDDVLKQLYAETNVPCDSLVSNPATLSAFARTYAERTTQEVEPAVLARRLLSLRKLGQAKGGLPKLRRMYHGRN
jgi:hypothetical protein